MSIAAVAGAMFTCIFACAAPVVLVGTWPLDIDEMRWLTSRGNRHRLPVESSLRQGTRFEPSIVDSPVQTGADFTTVDLVLEPPNPGRLVLTFMNSAEWTPAPAHPQGAVRLADAREYNYVSSGIPADTLLHEEANARAARYFEPKRTHFEQLLHASRMRKSISRPCVAVPARSLAEFMCIPLYLQEMERDYGDVPVDFLPAGVSLIIRTNNNNKGDQRYYIMRVISRLDIIEAAGPAQDARTPGVTIECDISEIIE